MVEQYKNTTLAVPREVYKKFRAYAILNGTTATKLLILAMRGYVEKYERENNA